jgi:hypothetical protein
MFTCLYEIDFSPKYESTKKMFTCLMDVGLSNPDINPIIKCSHVYSQV